MTIVVIGVVNVVIGSVVIIIIITIIGDEQLLSLMIYVMCHTWVKPR